MKIATVALLVLKKSQSHKLVETLSDDKEIQLFENLCESGEPDPYLKLQEYRDSQTREDNEFGDYVEELLCQPCVKPEVQHHAVQWLKSKIKIEKYRKNEIEAAAIISDYALKIFEESPDKTDFTLLGSAAQVRVKIFVFEEAQSLAA